MREKFIENQLRLAIERSGGTCEKFSSPGRTSVPDRICSMRAGEVFFVECKQPGEKATPAQLRDHKRRRDRGFRVFVIDNVQQINRLVHTRGVLA